MTREAAMPLHTQVDESSQDDELEVNPVYVRELTCEIRVTGCRSMARCRAPRCRWYAMS